MGGDSVDGALQLEAFGPVLQVRPGSLLAVVELVGGGVAADLPRTEAVGGLQILGLPLLVVGGVLLRVLVLVGGGDGWPHDFEHLVLGSGLLHAGAPPLLEVGLVVVQQVPERHFELLLELRLPALDRCRFNSAVGEVLRAQGRGPHEFHGLRLVEGLPVRLVDIVHALFGRELQPPSVVRLLLVDSATLHGGGRAGFLHLGLRLGHVDCDLPVDESLHLLGRGLGGSLGVVLGLFGTAWGGRYLWAGEGLLRLKRGAVLP